MLHRYILLFALLFVPIITQAQAFENGYLVVAPGDTLRGEVENLFWSDPPKSVRFRPTQAAPATVYAADQLKSVGLLSGRLLRRVAVPLDRGAQINLHKLPEGLFFNQKIDTVLADVLVEGTATLLEVKLDEVKHFLIQRETQPYLELTERRYLTKYDGGTRIMDGNSYRGQLLQYFSDCPEVVDAITRIPFTAESMARLVQIYNKQCSATRQVGREQTLIETNRGKVAVQIGPTLGLRYNTLRFRQQGANSTPGSLNGLELDGRLHGQIGVYFDILSPGRKLALHTALLYSRYGATARRNISATTLTSDLRGRMATLQVGLRGLHTQSSHYQLLYGTGIELHRFWDDAYAVRYGGVTSNLYLGFGSSWLPYVEGGIRNDRLTLTLNARRYGKQYVYYDYLYSNRTVSFTLALAYRLNGNTDAR